MCPSSSKPPPLFRRRIPLTSLSELVLPAGSHKQLEDIAQRVYLAPRLARHSPDSSEHARHRTTTVLFFGPPGTGKTTAAEALADNIELPLYQVDLSAVCRTDSIRSTQDSATRPPVPIDTKGSQSYIGETEKNLDRVFEAAERAGAILLFEEADALFGKRTEIKDAHDRYANIEIAYLLQRLEQHPGLVILTTNQEQNIDAAFLPRFTAVIDFPQPDAPAREQLWRQAIPPQVASDPIDFTQLAQHPLTGGDIHRATQRAIAQATAQAAPLTTLTLTEAVNAERLQRYGLTPKP